MPDRSQRAKQLRQREQARVAQAASNKTNGDSQRERIPFQRGEPRGKNAPFHARDRNY